MADISTYLAAIMSAVYGEDVRGSIHDAIDIINQVSEVVLTTGTAVTGPTSSSTGFFTDSLYLNTNTNDLWKCVGTDSWTKVGNLKGTGISSITKTSSVGLVDTYTIAYTDGTSSSFAVTNGKDGNQWYRGIAISGKSPVATVYATGIANANPNDFYLNPTEGAIYYCVSGGNATTATWAYDFTMAGGIGSINLDDLTDVSTSTASDGQIIQYNGLLMEWENKTPNLNTLSDVNTTTPDPNDVIRFDTGSNKYINAPLVDYHRTSGGAIMSTTVTVVGTPTTILFTGCSADKTYIPIADTTEAADTTLDGWGTQASYTDMKISGTTVSFKGIAPVNPTTFYLLEISI